MAGPRLLLISYHFPPSQAAGALRWQKMARFVAERGWGLDVITLDPAHLRAPDPTRLEDLPDDIRIYGVSQPKTWIERCEAGALAIGRRLGPKRRKPAAAEAQKARGMTGSGGAPPGSPVSPLASSAPEAGSLGRSDMRWMLRDARALRRSYHACVEYAHVGAWARHAAAIAYGIARPTAHIAVVSCGPPHMAHEAGRQVAARTGLPFVMDLRDPWSLVQRLPEHIASPLWLRLAERYERRAVRHAALVVMNTEPARAAMRAAHPDAPARIITVMNGCDDEPLLPCPTGRSRRFTIAYAGSIYLDRDPRPLLRAAAHVVREFSLRPDDFGIDLIGNVGGFAGVSIGDMARQEGLEAYVTVGPPRPRHEALKFLAQATVLVSLPQDSDMAIPSKVFEYMRFDAWLLALAERGSATEMVLRDSGADVVASDDLEGIVAVLRERYRQHAAGVTPRALATDGRFSRRTQAERLLDAIAECTGQRGSRAATALRTPMQVAG